MNPTLLITNLLMLILRVGMGVAIIHAGIQLLRGDALLAHTAFDSVITGVFVVLLGLYCVAFGLYNNLYRAIKEVIAQHRNT